eukprot:gene13135-27772_t
MRRSGLGVRELLVQGLSYPAVMMGVAGASIGGAGLCEGL